MRFLLDANLPYSSKEVFKTLDVKELENAVTIVELGRYRMRR